MKLATRHPGVPVLVVGDRVIDVADALKMAGYPGEAPSTVTSVLERWPELAGPLRAAEPVTDLAEVRFQAPVGEGQLIVCCGFNYAAHEAEVGGSAVGATWFIKNANAVTAPGAPILVPPDNAETIDYEGEVAVVIGRDCHRVGVADALSYVGGYTLVNDVSARLLSPPSESSDDIKRSVIDTHLGKQYPTFLPIGPVVVTADEIANPAELTFITSVNDAVVQRAFLSDMRLSVAQLIAWLSGVFEFRPGDIICTGSPAGSGVSQVPPRFLRDGDVVTVESPHIGSLRNSVVKEPK
ncbi:MAG: fumarylacetoacetate hydrolase family protein [Streptosporangiaceae bacterium]|jgi:acylpyruvate hydrolase